MDVDHFLGICVGAAGCHGMAEDCDHLFSAVDRDVTGGGLL